MTNNASDTYKSFIEFANKWGEAILNGDSKNANKSLKKIEKILGEIRKNSDAKLEIFLKQITENDSIGAQFLSANYLLCFDDKDAEAKMVHWKQRQDIFSNNANMALDLWKQKLLRLPS